MAAQVAGDQGPQPGAIRCPARRVSDGRGLGDRLLGAVPSTCRCGPLARLALQILGTLRRALREVRRTGRADVDFCRNP